MFNMLNLDNGEIVHKLSVFTLLMTGNMTTPVKCHNPATLLYINNVLSFIIEADISYYYPLQRGDRL